MAATSARAKPTSAPRAAPLTDAITLLKADHAEARQLFDRFDELCASRADADSRQSLIENLCAVLTAHTMIEEELFYPAARKTQLDLQAMANKMAARKEEILEVKRSEVAP